MSKNTYKVEHETETVKDLEGFPGVEVELVVSMTLDKYLDIGAMNALQSGEGNPLERTVTFAGNAKDWADEVIASWNLVFDRRDEDGKIVEADAPIPPSGKGFGMLPETLSTAIIKRWTQCLSDRRPSADEKKGSENGSSASANRKARRSSTRTRS